MARLNAIKRKYANIAARSLTGGSVASTSSVRATGKARKTAKPSGAIRGIGEPVESKKTAAVPKQRAASRTMNTASTGKAAAVPKQRAGSTMRKTKKKIK